MHTMLNDPAGKPRRAWDHTAQNRRSSHHRPEDQVLIRSLPYCCKRRYGGVILGCGIMGLWLNWYQPMS